MKGRLIVAGALLAAVLPALPSTARAQSDACLTQPLPAQDACQKALDLFNFMAPQLGTSIAGGAAIQGSGGTLGGLGHFSVGVRANVVNGVLPQIDQMHTDVVAGPQRDEIVTKNQVLGLPAVDAAIGVFRGIPVGLTEVAGVDLLVNVAYLPELQQSGFALETPGGSLKLGYGARIGLLQESSLMPGVSVTYLKRDLPTITLSGMYQGTGSADDTLQLRNLALETDAWRVVVSKRVLLFGLAAGAGQDRYTSVGDMRANVGQFDPAGDIRTETTPLRFEQTLTRTNYFANVSMNLFMLKLVGEVGQVSGGSVETYNTFGDKRADDSLLYGSLGVRVGF